MKNSMNGNGLSRDIGLFSATVLVIANMVGTGIFTTTGFIMAELRSPVTLLLSWAAGGVFALCGALCYGELGARYPKAGGEYVFLRESFGRPFGFLSGWISLIVGFSAPIAAASMAFASYLFNVLAVPGGKAPLIAIGSLTLTPLNLTAVSVIVLISLVHYHSLRTGTRVQNGLTVFKFALAAGFVIAGFLWGHGDAGHFRTVSGSGPPLSPGTFAVSLIFISFAYSGWNAAAYLGSEIVDPERNIPLSLLLGTAGVTLLYLALNALYIYALPPGAMAGVLEIGAAAAGALFGGSTGRWFAGAVSIGLLSVISAMVMTGPRIYYAMSRDRVFFDVFGRLDPDRRTPASSIFLQAAIAGVLVVSASFDTLLIYIGFTLSLFAMLTVTGLMRLRMTGRDDGGTGYRTFGYPVTPLVFILCNLWIIVYSLKERPLAALFGLGTIGAGAAFYAVFVRHRTDSPAEYGITSSLAAESEGGQ